MFFAAFIKDFSFPRKSFVKPCASNYGDWRVARAIAII